MAPLITMTPSATVVPPSDALVDVMPQSVASGEAQLARVTAVGRAVYQLKVGDWVYVVNCWCRSSAGEPLCVPQADFNCLRLPPGGRLG